MSYFRLIATLKSVNYVIYFDLYEEKDLKKEEWILGKISQGRFINKWAYKGKLGELVKYLKLQNGFERVLNEEKRPL